MKESNDRTDQFVHSASQAAAKAPPPSFTFVSLFFIRPFENLCLCLFRSQLLYFSPTQLNRGAIQRKG